MKKGGKIALIIIGSLVAVVAGLGAAYLIMTNNQDKVNESQWKECINRISDLNNDKRNFRIEISDWTQSSVQKTYYECVKNWERTTNEGKTTEECYKSENSKIQKYDFSTSQWVDDGTRQILPVLNDGLIKIIINEENKYSDYQYDKEPREYRSKEAKITYKSVKYFLVFGFIPKPYKSLSYITFRKENDTSAGGDYSIYFYDINECNTATWLNQ